MKKKPNPSKIVNVLVLHVFVLNPMPIPTSDDIQKARRNASRNRVLLACKACKQLKIRCNDMKPCKFCRQNLKECYYMQVSSAHKFLNGDWVIPPASWIV
jgi:hypothetical protein